MSLRSEIPNEVKYALYHLLKISVERGDKFRFDAFIGLNRDLTRVVCNVSTLYYQDHPGWDWVPEGVDDYPDRLDQMEPTKNIMQKIRHYRVKDTGTVQDAEFQDGKRNVYAAIQILRNMAQLDDNAEFLSEDNLVRDMLVICFQLPMTEDTHEIMYDALEIAWRITRYWTLQAGDPVYDSLVRVLENNLHDMSFVIAGLVSLGHIGEKLKVPNPLQLPDSILEKLHGWLLTEHTELRETVMDFVYMYVTTMEGVQNLVRLGLAEKLIDAHMSFLLCDAVYVPWKSASEPPYEPQQVAATFTDSIPKLAPSIIDKLGQINDAREQSTAWSVMQPTQCFSLQNANFLQAPIVFRRNSRRRSDTGRNVASVHHSIQWLQKRREDDAGQRLCHPRIDRLSCRCCARRPNRRSTKVCHARHHASSCARRPSRPSIRALPMAHSSHAVSRGIPLKRTATWFQGVRSVVPRNPQR
jgi:chromatin structure-remodeling complex subunit RSC9